MPSDATATCDPITERCYCGAYRFRAVRLPQVVTYCHCTDCRRVTGAPVAAFAAFAPDDVIFAPRLPASVSVHDGVTRWFCETCGSPMAATYAYLPEQMYLSLGLIDQADSLPPSLHAHAENALCWLTIEDTLPRQTGSSRNALQSARVP